MLLTTITMKQFIAQARNGGDVTILTIPKRIIELNDIKDGDLLQMKIMRITKQ